MQVMVNVTPLDSRQRIVVTTFMDVTTSYIIELEVLEKRETNMKSVTMEKQALQNILLRLRGLLTITEVVTDASASIKKLTGMIN